MSRAEVLFLAALAFLAGVFSVPRGAQVEIEAATTRTALTKSAVVPSPDGIPEAVPDPYALFAPCPVTKRTIPTIRKNVV